MSGKKEALVFGETEPISTTLPELKNESTSPRKDTYYSSSSGGNSKKFDPIPMNSSETRYKSDTRRTIKSRPCEKVRKISTRSTPKKKVCRETQANRPDDETIRITLENYVNDGTVPPLEMREYIIQLINRERVKFLLNGEYSSAKGIDALQKSLNNSYHQEAVNNAIAQRSNTLNEKRAEYQQRWEEENTRWDQRVEQQMKDNEEYNNEMKERHSEEFQAFKERWQAPEFIETFNKPSNLLLNLRYQETKLALTRNYDGAEELKVYANKQQKIEEEQMKRNMEAQMRKEFTAMKERHASEIENAKFHQEKTLETIEMQRQRALKTFQTTDKPLQVSKISLNESKRDACPMSQLQTPRTANSLINFRYQRHAKLNLAPMAEGDFEKLEERPKSQCQSRHRSPSKSSPYISRTSSRASRRLLPAL